MSKRAIIATWISTGLDQDGNPVPKIKYNATKYPKFSDWLTEEYKIDPERFLQQIGAIHNLAVQTVVREANSTDPVDTSHVVTYTITEPNQGEDEVVSLLVEELTSRTTTSLTKGFVLELADTHID